jgi:hypothetical protein
MSDRRTQPRVRRSARGRADAASRRGPRSSSKRFTGTSCTAERPCECRRRAPRDRRDREEQP